MSARPLLKCNSGVQCLGEAPQSCIQGPCVLAQRGGEGVPGHEAQVTDLPYKGVAQAGHAFQSVPHVTSGRERVRIERALSPLLWTQGRDTLTRCFLCKPLISWDIAEVACLGLRTGVQMSITRCRDPFLRRHPVCRPAAQVDSLELF